VNFETFLLGCTCRLLFRTQNDIDIEIEAERIFPGKTGGKFDKNTKNTKSSTKTSSGKRV
jgi:hypothetical protein